MQFRLRTVQSTHRSASRSQAHRKLQRKDLLRALQTADLDISGGTIEAASANDSAITAKTRLSITGNVQVIARGKVCALLTEDEMILSAKNIKAYSDTNYAVSNVGTGKDITIGGKLTAESEKVYAIRSYGNIITDSNADISATGAGEASRQTATSPLQAAKLKR